MYEITSHTLQSMPDTERMLFNVNMKLCRSYVEREDFTKAGAVLEQLHSSCRLPSGEDDKKNKGAELIEIYALLIRISTHTKDTLKLKVAHRTARSCAAQLHAPHAPAGLELLSPRGVTSNPLSPLLRHCTTPRRTCRWQ